MSETRRLSMALVLENLRRRGFSPGTVVDVGAHSGTPLLTLAFPAAHHVMIEPLVEHGPALQAACDGLASAEYLIAAAGSHDGVMELRVDKQSLHSYEASKSASSVGVVRGVKSVRLDRLHFAGNWKEPLLVKIDVDGAEMDVLKGAAGLMDMNSVFIVEVSPFGTGLLKPMQFFDDFDFVLFDLADPLYRESDDALWQADFVFVHKDSFLRRHKGYP